MEQKDLARVDARDYEGRPSQLDDLTSGLKDVVDGVQKTSKGIEVVKKHTWGLWAVAAALLVVAFEFGIWVTNYNRNAQDGSPALVKLDEKWTKQQSDNFNELNAKITAISAKDDARYDKLNEILIKVSTIQDQQSQRLDRLETR